MNQQAALRMSPEIFIESLKSGEQARAIHVVKFGLPADASIVGIYHDRSPAGRRELVIVLEAQRFETEALSDERYMGWAVLRSPWCELARGVQS